MFPKAYRWSESISKAEDISKGSPTLRLQEEPVFMQQDIMIVKEY